MDKLILTLEIVFPLFLIIILGYVLRQIKLLPASFADQSSRLLFFVVLPILFAEDLWNADLSQGYPPKLLLILLLGTTLTALLAWGVTKLLHAETGAVASFINSAFRSNFVYIGYPLLGMMLGEVPSVVSLSFLLIITIFNLFASLIYPSKTKESGVLQKAWGIIRGVFTNPLNIGVLLGLVLNLLRVPQPKLLATTMGMVSSIASPLALISIGVSFDLQLQKKYLSLAFAASLIKLVASPLIGLGLGLALRMPVEELMLIFAVFSTPTALNTFAIDREMGGNEDLVSTTILVSTLLAMVTLTLFVFTFFSTGLL